MPDDPSISDAIRENATGPKKASNETTSAEQHPLPDQIAAAKFLGNQAATSGRKLGVRFGKFTTPGASEHG